MRQEPLGIAIIVFYIAALIYVGAFPEQKRAAVSAYHFAAAITWTDVSTWFWTH